MAHFAKINKLNGRVMDVVVVDNSILLKDNKEDEALGVAFLKQTLKHSDWVQTSYNGNFRKNYAGVGFVYDKAKDAFISPQPYHSWMLDKDCQWQPPKPYPSDTGDVVYNWDETKLDWSVNNG